LSPLQRFGNVVERFLDDVQNLLLDESGFVADTRHQVSLVRVIVAWVEVEWMGINRFNPASSAEMILKCPVLEGKCAAFERCAYSSDQHCCKRVKPNAKMMHRHR